MDREIKLESRLFGSPLYRRLRQSVWFVDGAVRGQLYERWLRIVSER